MTTKKAVNHDIAIIKIPLYIKAAGFINRDYWYRYIVENLTENLKTDREKAVAIFDWTLKNIHNVPKGFDIVDDHILNIIIRRYGTLDQKVDVFTTICFYSGIDAFWDFCYDDVNNIVYPLSFVKLDGRWHIFDCNVGKYFETNSTGDIDIEDALKYVSSSKDEILETFAAKGISLDRVYRNLRAMKEVSRSRAAQQIPFKRIFFELKKSIVHK